MFLEFQPDLFWTKQIASFSSTSKRDSNSKIKMFLRFPSFSSSAFYFLGLWVGKNTKNGLIFTYFDHIFVAKKLVLLLPGRGHLSHAGARSHAQRRGPEQLRSGQGVERWRSASETKDLCLRNRLETTKQHGCETKLSKILSNLFKKQ